MRPITHYLPKVLVPLCGRPLLEHTLVQLDKEGFGPFLVNTHWFHDHVAAFCARSPVPFAISHERERILGSGGGVRHAREWLCRDELCCVANAEPVRGGVTNDIADEFRRSGATIGLACVRVARGATIFSHAGTREYAGTTADALEPGTVDPWAFIGLTLLRREAFELLRESDFSIVPVWARAARAGGATVLLDAGGGCWWYDIGTLQQLAAAHLAVCRGSLDLELPPGLVHDREGGRVFPAHLSPRDVARCGPSVWLEARELPAGCRFENAVVVTGARVRGTAYLEQLLTPWGEFSLAGGEP